MRIVPILFVFVFFLAGCDPGVTNLSDPVRERLALCGAGITNIVSAGLEAQIGKSLEDFGSISAEAKNDLRAAFLGADGVSNSDQQKAFDRYVECVERPL